MRKEHTQICYLGATYLIAILWTVDGFRFSAKTHTLSELGCYVDIKQQPDMNLLLYEGELNTHEKCSRECKARWYLYAAVQNGDMCWCSNTFGKHGRAIKSDCEQRLCPGDPRKFCGGHLRNFIMRTGYAPESKEDVGKCWTINTRNTMTNAYKGKLNSHSFCSSVCGAIQKKFAGVHNGNQCWCGDDLFFDDLIPDNECVVPCSGNSEEKCGSKGAMMLLHSFKAVDGVIEGCYSDGKTNALTPLLNGNSKQFFVNRNYKNLYKTGYPGDNKTMTPKFCQNYCRTRSFRLAGLEGGVECWCGNKFNVKVLLMDNQKCNTPCRGDLRLTCGGQYRMFVMTTGFS